MKAPDALLESGLAAYRANDFRGAADDLFAAAQAYMSDERMAAYISSGKLEGLPSLEKALVYLALAQARLGTEDEARQTIVRLLTAERIEPTYARLALGSDAAELEALAARLVPENPLPKNVTAIAAAPPAPPAPERVQPRTEIAIVTPPPVPPAPERVQPKQVAVVTEPTPQPALERALPKTPIAAVPEPPAQPAPVQPAPRSTAPRVTAAPSSVHRELLGTLRQAEALAANDERDQANAIYRRVASGENVPREILIVAAVGLYRTNAYADAVEAFRRIGTFAKGEEDLRFYNAVVLFESGSYEAANKELACALPFIEATDDVMRYRAKIERMAAVQQAMR